MTTQAQLKPDPLKALARIGIERPQEALLTLPRRYIDYSQPVDPAKLACLQHGMRVSQSGPRQIAKLSVQGLPFSQSLCDPIGFSASPGPGATVFWIKITCSRFTTRRTARLLATQVG